MWDGNWPKEEGNSNQDINELTNKYIYDLKYHPLQKENPQETKQKQKQSMSSSQNINQKIILCYN